MYHRTMSSQALELAGPAKTTPNGHFSQQIDVEDPDFPLKQHVAQLYGRGFTRQQIARALAEQLRPGLVGKPRARLLHGARKKLISWEQQQKFRDMVWAHAQISI